MELIVEVKNVYGTEKIYPVCEKAKTLAALTDSITLTNKVITHAKKLGFTFTVKAKEVKL
jgi:hypothetical protein